jgi:hypothetical protein
MPPKSLPFRMTAPLVPGAESELVVGDEPWHKAHLLTRVAVVHEVGKATQLFVTLAAGGVIEGEAEITQILEGESPLAWLDSLDADELDDAVNAKLQVSPGSYPELCLQVLKEWARRG